MRIKCSIVGLFIAALCYSQVDTSHVIKIYFLYGSKPLKAYKTTEFKHFGGLHGGHVSIQVNQMDYGFEPTNTVHVFAHCKHYQANFVDNSKWKHALRLHK
ncbi:MAG: hypothetical protein V4580_19645 [Bacteroidota bacterium]